MNGVNLSQVLDGVLDSHRPPASGNVAGLLCSLDNIYIVKEIEQLFNTVQASNVITLETIFFIKS